MTPQELIRQSIRAIPDFPKPGIIFRDIAPILSNPEVFSSVIQLLKETFEGKVEAVAGIDSRGFIFGAPLACSLSLPFVMIRKPGKLPGEVQSESYSLEYGESTLEIQTDALPQGTKVLLIDDLLATGGSASAAVSLLQSIGVNVVAATFIIELAGLGGRETIHKTNPDIEITSIVTFDESL